MTVHLRCDICGEPSEHHSDTCPLHPANREPKPKGARLADRAERWLRKFRPRFPTTGEAELQALLQEIIVHLRAEESRG